MLLSFGKAAAQTIHYTYDPLGRLTNVLYPDSSAISYAYDAAGNRTSIRKKNDHYVFSLPQTNFLFTVSSTTCRGTADGKISISSAQPLQFTAKLSTAGTIQNKTFSDTISFNGLAAGTYPLTITIADQPSYSLTDSLVISQPADLSVYAVLNKNTLSLSLGGGDHYFISLNGQAVTPSGNSATLNLLPGNNTVAVVTDKPCQGSYAQTFYVTPEMTPYPDPFDGIVKLNTGQDIIATATVQVNAVSDGKLVYTKIYQNISGTLQIDLSALANGVYALHFSTGKMSKTFKIIKQ